MILRRPLQCSLDEFSEVSHVIDSIYNDFFLFTNRDVKRRKYRHKVFDPIDLLFSRIQMLNKPLITQKSNDSAFMDNLGAYQTE